MAHAEPTAEQESGDHGGGTEYSEAGCKGEGTERRKKMKMEKFSDCHTRWEGLWYHKEMHNYTSASLNLASLKGFKGTCRVRMIKNLKKGERQPNYLFTISSVDEDENDVDEIEIQQGNGDDQQKLCELKELLLDLRDLVYSCHESGHWNSAKLAKLIPNADLEKAICMVDELIGEE